MSVRDNGGTLNSEIELVYHWYLESAPGYNSRTKDRLKYYIDLAKLAEKHKITCIFFADTYAGHDVYGENMDAVLRAGTQVAQLDPLVIISAEGVRVQLSG